MNQRNFEGLYIEAKTEIEKLKKEVNRLRLENEKYKILNKGNKKEEPLKPEEIKPGMKVFYKGINKPIEIESVNTHGSIRARVLNKNGLSINHFVIIPSSLNDGTTLFKL